MSKYKLVIFESNRKDGCMSLAKKFYSKNDTEAQIREKLSKVKIKLGKKYGFNGNHILQPCQKDVEPNLDYPDGQYTKINKKFLTKKDYWYEKIPADIILIDTEFPNVVIGHRMADCPVIIAEDIKKQVVAVAHCGSRQINREVPKWTIQSLKKEINSNQEDIHVYIGSCIKKENYQYDKYPSWATNKTVWQDCIRKKENKYYIDLVFAIKKQLKKEKITEKNITVSPVDTYTNENYYSHTKEKQENPQNIGQNFVGCFYQEVKSS